MIRSNDPAHVMLKVPRGKDPREYLDQVMSWCIAHDIVTYVVGEWPESVMGDADPIAMQEYYQMSMWCILDLDQRTLFQLRWT